MISFKKENVEELIKNIFLVFLYGLTIFLGTKFIIYYINKAGQSPLTQLELIYFTLILSIITLIISVGATHFFSKIQAKKEMKLLGQSAIRHIKQIIVSSRILSETVERKIDILKGKTKKEDKIPIELVSEYLENILNQISALRMGINTAKGDWANVLKEEIKESLESDEELWGYLKEINALKNEIEEKNKAINEMGAKAEKESTEYKKLLQEKEKQIKLLQETENKLRSKIIEVESKPSVWPTLLNTSSAASITSVSGDISPLQSAFLYSANCEICGVYPQSQTCSKCGKGICILCAGSTAGILLGGSVICKECASKKYLSAP